MYPKMLDKAPPRRIRAVMSAIAIKAAIRAYSIAVGPFSSENSARSLVCIVVVRLYRIACSGRMASSLATRGAPGLAPLPNRLRCLLRRVYGVADVAEDVRKSAAQQNQGCNDRHRHQGRNEA